MPDDPFSHMSWKEFEDFVIDLLDRIYITYGVRVEKTPYQNDGGRDGYGSLFIAPFHQDIGADLSLALRFWAEVKKRSSGKVDIDDIGGHLILAIHRSVNKIIFITNGNFSERALHVCAQVGRRLNVAVAFINGTTLNQLNHHYSTETSPVPSFTSTSEFPGKPDRTKGLSLRTGFVAGPEDELDTAGFDLMLERGEIGYWVCEISGRMTGLDGGIALTWPSETDGGLQTACLSQRHFDVEALDMLQRFVFACWSNESGRFAAALPTVIETGTGQVLPVTVQHGHGMLVVNQTILVGDLPSSRLNIIADIEADFTLSPGQTGVSCAMIEANAGTGKSFLVDRLRQKILKEGIREVRLDGERQSRVDAVVQAVLRQAFPLPADMLPSVSAAALQGWLQMAEQPDDPDSAMGRSADAADIIALMSGSDAQATDPEVVNLIAATLINASASGSVMLTFEDLHKANASVLDFLQRLVAALTARKKGRVHLLLTTRPYIAPGIKEGERGEWEKALRAFDSFSGRVSIHRLQALSAPEARALLQASLQHLSAAEADMIIGQVGTSPFFLKETLQFLRTTGTVALDGTGRAWLERPEGIHDAVRRSALLTATEARLQWLVSRTGGWLERFLVAAACLGKQFGLADALATCNGDGADLDRGLKLCADHDVLHRVPRAVGETVASLSFDHDLIRMAVLRNAGSSFIAETAQRLCDLPARQAPDGSRLVLSYLAGVGGTCLQTAHLLLKEGKTRRNHWETLQYALIRVSVLFASDGVWRTETFLRPHLEGFDDAFAFVEPPRLPQTPAPSEMIGGILDLLEQMEHVGMLESELSARLITLGAIKAEYAGDWHGQARLKFFDGRRLFGRNQYKDAYGLFQEAEADWPAGPAASDPMLAKIRLRIAICERHLGRLDDARATMVRALRLRGGSDWHLFEQVAANLGAFYMYTDQKRAQGYWEKGLRVARLSGHADELVHFTNDLAHLKLMQGDYRGALVSVNEVDEMVRNHSLLKEGIRCNIFRGCAFLALGRLSAARHALAQAEEQAVANNDLRRLWRVRANMGTLAELEGDAGQAMIRDRQSLVHMPIHTEFRYPIGVHDRGNRVVGALINIVSRYRSMPDAYHAIPDVLGEPAWSAAVALANELDGTETGSQSFAGGILCLHHPVGDGMRRRFLITE